MVFASKAEKVKLFHRYEVGEGLEKGKRVDNFVEEVMGQS